MINFFSYLFSWTSKCSSIHRILFASVSQQVGLQVWNYETLQPANFWILLACILIFEYWDRVWCVGQSWFLSFCPTDAEVTGMDHQMELKVSFSNLSSLVTVWLHFLFWLIQAWNAGILITGHLLCSILFKKETWKNSYIRKRFFILNL